MAVGPCESSLDGLCGISLLINGVTKVLPSTWTEEEMAPVVSSDHVSSALCLWQPGQGVGDPSSGHWPGDSERELVRACLGGLTPGGMVFLLNEHCLGLRER